MREDKKNENNQRQSVEKIKLMENNYLSNLEYLSFINELKSLYRESQIKAFVKVNRELLNFNWYLGKKIIEKQQFYNWGDGFITNLSKDN